MCSCEKILRPSGSAILLKLPVVISLVDVFLGILGRLSDLKYGDKARVIEIAEANNDFKRAIRLRKQLNKMQDMESEISVLIQIQK